MADLIPPRRSELLTRGGVPTQRFAEYLEALTSKTNTTTAAVSVNSDGSAARAQLFALQEQVGSGDFLTWDEDGFTWDSDNFTFDQDEA